MVACATIDAPVKPIVFSHHLHTEQGVGCADCHGALATDVSSPARPIPVMADCGACHEIAKPEACPTCHGDAARPNRYPERPDDGIVYSHERHAPRQADCAACHTAAAHAPQLPRVGALAPAMDDCRPCHAAAIDGGDCRLCHERLDRYDRKPETLYRHDAGFFARHGLRAQGEETNCAQCHDQAFCADCHARTQTVSPAVRWPERVDRALVHRGDFLSRHALEARVDASGCLKCHGPSSCASCHERQGLGGATGVRNPHPAAWMNPGPDGHGRAARRDIVRCAACHDQGPFANCVRCHAVGGVNPHPPGWNGHRADTRRDPTCRVCHAR